MALGSGALLGKLHLWNHRLAKEWSRKKSMTERAIGLIKNPQRSILDMYKGKYASIGYSIFLSKYEIDEKILTRPKTFK
jgi:hypothetical protein